MILTYANQLTILRMVFIPFFVVLLVYGYTGAATLIFIIAGVTDAFDGMLARKLGQKTSLGSFLDPMADKLLVASAFVTLTIPAVPVALHIPAWLTITALSRDILIALAALIIHLQTGHAKFPPTLLGKWTTTFQLLTVGLALVANFTSTIDMVIFLPVVYATLLFTVASGMHYFYRSVRIIESYPRTESRNDEEGDQDH